MVYGSSSHAFHLKIGYALLMRTVSQFPLSPLADRRIHQKSLIRHALNIDLVIKFEYCFSKAKVAYEIRGEIHDRGVMGSYRFKGTLITAFKSFMEYVNDIRKNELYEHKTRDCHAHCKARGCGVSFSVDGLWKIRFIL